MGFLSNMFVDLIDKFPDKMIWKFARRYIAGSDLASGLAVRAKLFDEGMDNTMDILGEDTINMDQAESSYRQYCDLITGMSHSGIPGNISLKLTQLGLKIDQTFTRQKVFELAHRASEKGFFFRFDMEDSTTTTQTLDLYRDLRQEISECGVVIQAYLKRSESDVRSLLEAKPANIRICKGIYRESTDIAWNDRQTIRESYLHLLNLVFDMGGYPAIATHDPYLIRKAMDEVSRRKLPPDRYEFQMLHGVGFGWRRSILQDGHRLRIYIPFGEAWRAYSFRRFRENPKLAIYVMKNLIAPE
ncbi:proline dehydrogenase family protein [bacterium]|nr:proline dehydrogenase family protein [candidate division CSSED10-310 bacterium]